MGVPIRRAVLCAGLIAATGLAGCSSSGGSGSPQPSGSAGGGACARVSPGRGVTTHGSDQKAVTQVFRLFFSTATSLSRSMAVLQHGKTFCGALQAESNSSYGKQKTNAQVSSVRIDNPRLATVTFTIKVAGQAVLPHTHGYAVKEGGKWKVAAQTFCQLLTLEGTAPAACKDKSITSLHG